MNSSPTHFSVGQYLPALHPGSMSTITSLFSLVAFKAAACHFVQFSIENELLI